MTLLDTAERFASLDRSQVVLDAARCLHSQDQFSQCAACYDVCPVQAISAGRPPALEAAACQSCLACIPACPMGAYQADDDVSSLLNCAAHVEGKSVELLCGLHPHPEMGAEAGSLGIQLRGCLAGLGSAAYLSLSALGMERIALRTDGCSECRWVALEKHVRHNADTARGWLAAWDRGGQLVCVEKMETAAERPYWNAKNPPLSRRDLFRMLGRQGQMAVARAMENDQAGHEKQPGRERRRMLSAMEHLPPPASFPEIKLEGFALLSVSETCTACGVCEKACPTQALHFEVDEAQKTYRLSLSAQDCTGCEVCVHVCAPASITLESAPTFEQVFGQTKPALLRTGSLVRCQNCRSWMAERPSVKLCPVCEYRRAHPFGSIMPPGLMHQMTRARKEPRV